jgi:hypothetical protein
MNDNDKELLEIYLKGFNDELYEKYFNIYSDTLKSRAYELGKDHAIIGDMVRAVDYLSDEQVLKLIKNE